MDLYYIGLFCMLAVGIVLGLLGGGGAILAVPIMIYLLRMNKLDATGYSLFVVGATALIGAIKYLQKNPQEKNIVLTTVLNFAPISIGIGILTRYIIQKLPYVLFQIGKYSFTKEFGMMSIFAIVMVIVAYNMIKGNNNIETTPNPVSRTEISLQAIKVGLLSGLAGAGGGFLITPTLHNALNMKMKQAVGTSLWIISANAWFIFLGDIFTRSHALNWHLLILTAFIAIIGVLIGNQLSSSISNEKLKPIFGYFVLIMGGLILYMEFKSL